MHTLKLVMIGSTKSGKSTIANFLADASEIPYDYHPTQGVRILEFEVNDIEVNNERISRDIELWDCSGDHKYKKCWPVLRNGAHGVMLVYNSKNIQNSAKELRELYDYFVTGAKLSANNCVIFYYDPDNITGMSKVISSSFSHVSHVKCNTDDGADKLQNDFRLFLSALLTKPQEDKDEKLILSDNILFAK